MSDWHTDTAKPFMRLSERAPTETDSDCVGDVLFLRSGVEVLGNWRLRPVDATHWRCTYRKDVLHCANCHTTTRTKEGRCTDCGGCEFSTWKALIDKNNR